ncbi:MAG: methylated-DNA--[protein]-cysteine S-methyltransferase [Thermodesulfovibrionales bacterium]
MPAQPETHIIYDIFSSPLGLLYIIFSDNALAGIIFSNEVGKSTSSIPHSVKRIKKGRVPENFRQQLIDYFEGKLREFKQEVILLSGTEFEKSVWLTLREIPYGETRSYKWVAERIGKPKAVRAVGRALSKNPIPIVLPCHRVIESDGSIGGYSSGVERKRRLLNLEYFFSRLLT